MSRDKSLKSVFMRIRNYHELVDGKDSRRSLLETFAHTINSLEVNQSLKDMALGNSRRKDNQIELNEFACKAAKEYIESWSARYNKKQRVYYLPAIEGKANEVVANIKNMLLELYNSGDAPCHVVMGQVDIEVNLSKTPASGGKSLEQAAQSLLELKGYPNISILYAKTDGMDGNTNVAGAIVDYWTVIQSSFGINLAYYLKDNQSYALLSQLKCVVRTGRTDAPSTRLVIAKIDKE